MVGEHVTVSGTCVVDKNCWTYKDIGSLWNVIWNMIKSAMGAITDMFLAKRNLVKIIRVVLILDLFSREFSFSHPGCT
ncbi:MAG: hypothetical protein MZV63_63455 [Marinilabiliales bacterium]|nr:hypothetical protein [Marinilabiliales bacterium]